MEFVVLAANVMKKLMFILCVVVVCVMFLFVAVDTIKTMKAPEMGILYTVGMYTLIGSATIGILKDWPDDSN